MNEKIFYYGLLELGISILIGIPVLYISYRVIDKLIRRKYDIDKNTTEYKEFNKMRLSFYFTLMLFMILC